MAEPRHAGPWRIALAAAGGATLSACFLSFSLWPLGWLAVAPMVLAAVTAPTARAAIVVGLAAGLAANVPAFHWLVGTIHRFGGFPLPVAVVFYAVLSLYSSLQFVIFALVTRRTGLGPLALAPAATWVALELLYPTLFPWRLAHSQIEVPVLLQTGELAGPFGLSFVMAWFGAACIHAWLEGRRAATRSLPLSIVTIAGVVAYGLVRMPIVEREIEEAPPVRVGLVQGNLDIEEKGDVSFFESNLATYRKLTLEIADRADVVIWPETVIGEPIPRGLEKLPRGAVATLGLRKPLLTGALTYEGPPERPRFYNSVILLAPDGSLLGMSDKLILMPFGEYMPLGSWFPVLRRLSPQTGNFEAGTEVRVLDVPDVGRFAPLNCYEDLRDSIPRRVTAEKGAEVLFAVANDAWFGNTMAPFQHEALALFRTVENRRFLVRVTNTGVTDVIDPLGRVVVRLPVFEKASHVATIRRLEGRTVYHAIGNGFAWLMVAVSVGLVVFSGRGRRDRSAPPTRPRSRG